MTNQVIYDRGYRPYDGPRRGPRGARRAVFKEGLRRLLGLGRKARAKVFPWALITVAMVQALVFVGIHWAIGDVAESIGQGVPSYGELFDFYSWIALIFIAFAGPTLLIPDRAHGVLSVYFSRPLTVDGYLTSKFGAFATVVALIYMVPQILLHTGLALISTDGFITYVTDNLDVLWKVPTVTASFILVHGALIFILSALIRRTGMAAAAFLGTIIATNILGAAMSQVNIAGARWLSLLALDQHARIIKDDLFDITVNLYPATEAGFTTWTSMMVILGLGLVAAWFVRARYRRLA